MHASIHRELCAHQQAEISRYPRHTSRHDYVPGSWHVTKESSLKPASGNLQHRAPTATSGHAFMHITISIFIYAYGDSWSESPSHDFGMMLLTLLRYRYAQVVENLWCPTAKIDHGTSTVVSSASYDCTSCKLSWSIHVRVTHHQVWRVASHANQRHRVPDAQESLRWSRSETFVIISVKTRFKHAYRKSREIRMKNLL